MTERYTDKKYLVSLTSGGGSTFGAIAESSLSGELHRSIRVVGMIASRDGIGSIEKAKRLSIPFEVLDRRMFPKGTRGDEQYGRALLALLNVWSPDIVTQNGWLVRTPPLVIDEVGEIYNQHPAPLDPANRDAYGKALHFGGKGIYGPAPHAAVLEFQRRTDRRFPTEATVHRVTSEFDDGAVVYRQQVMVEDGDTPESLQQRVLPVEHAAQIAFLRQFARNEVAVQKRDEPLVKPWEEIDLWASLEYARQQYPNG